ncbi:benenodin family lasso peptide [Coralloluteibacterium stylophorae]|uniref:Benenodin family lasso peptide n=1 Tax=Coralloluteibacterium stylophorae TaxID=1776034 RepID=A0A8J8AXW9_9GAMM|nr:benenodin family lasso peptide [Coralloluteibacterium stylophorae]MBS7456839.1 benenodin family lasso peptide [Coralloluteibacterium stylophorae]
MNANDNAREQVPQDVIELGVASIETKGMAGITENFGVLPLEGISEA